MDQKQVQSHGSAALTRWQEDRLTLHPTLSCNRNALRRDQNEGCKTSITVRILHCQPLTWAESITGFSSSRGEDLMVVLVICSMQCRGLKSVACRTLSRGEELMVVLVICSVQCRGLAWMKSVAGLTLSRGEEPMVVLVWNSWARARGALPGELAFSYKCCWLRRALSASLWSRLYSAA